MEGFEQRGDGIGFPCERLCVEDIESEGGNWETSDRNNLGEMLMACCTVVEVL